MLPARDRGEGDTAAVDEVSYRIVVVERDGRWVARAESPDTGRRFGIECAAGSEGEAAERLTIWIEWQRAHAAALETLQKAERAYHRAIAGSAFKDPTEGPSPLETQKASLAAVEAACAGLDDIRARQPE